MGKGTIICGEIVKKRIIGNPKEILPRTFNDYAFLAEGDFICGNCLWSMKQEKILGNTLVFKGDVIYMQGKNMKQKNAKEQQKFRDNFFRNIDEVKPLFLLSLKSTANTQHTVFKNKTSISNAMINVGFGNEEEVMVDVELLKEAIIDLENITTKYKTISKTHLINLEKIDDKYPIINKKNLSKEVMQVLQDFWKKYDRSIRKVLNRVMV